MSSQNASRLDAMIKLARAKCIVEPGRLDNDPWVMNCRNGILDLKQGKLLPHDPQKLHAKLCDVEFNAEAKCPIWINFIKEITSGDQELIQFGRYSPLRGEQGLAQSPNCRTIAKHDTQKGE